jgi:hypothetical protein
MTDVEGPVDRGDVAEAVVAGRPVQPTDTDEQRRRMAVTVVLALLALVAVAVPGAIALRATSSGANAAGVSEIGTNRLGAATLDIELGSAEATLTATNMAPGDTVSGRLDLTNAGTLPLIYAISATTDGGALGAWLRFDVWAADDCAVSPATDSLLVAGLLLGAPQVPVLGDPTTGRQSGDRSLAPADAETICLQATLPPGAGNDSQGESLVFDLIIDAEHDIATTEAGAATEAGNDGSAP